APDGLSTVDLRRGAALDISEGLAQAAVRGPGSRIGLQRAMEPRERSLPIAELRCDRRAIAVRTRERGRQADRFVEEPRRAVHVSIPEVALARDDAQLLGALGDLAVASEADLDVASGRLLVAGR